MLQTQKDTRGADLYNRLVAYTASVHKLWRRYHADRSLEPIFHQVSRSAGSIGANMSEAKGSQSRAGFARYFRIALQSANETRYWLDVLEAEGTVSAKDIASLQGELSEFLRILRASLKTMQSKGR